MNDLDSQMKFSDYWQILSRRRYHFPVPFILVVAFAAALAFLLPAMYRSEATLIVERQAIPKSVIQTTVSGYAQEQILQTRQRIITPQNLTSVAEKFHLYPEEYAKDPLSVVSLIRNNIDVQMVEVEATDPDKAGKIVATIAFTVAYSANSPESAKAVTEEFTRLYLDEDKRGRIATTEIVTNFLMEETEKQRQDLADLESRLAIFKQQEMRQLPELMGTNLRLYETTELNIERSDQLIREFLDRIDAMKAELSLTSPYKEVESEDGRRIQSASDRLTALTATFLRSTARYSAQHPDIIRITREIRVLAEQTGEIGRIDEVMGELIRLQESLRQARQKYNEAHPEVQKLVVAVAAMQKGFQTIVVSGTTAPSSLEIPPDNPRYVALKTQLDSTQANLAVERRKLVTLNEKLIEFEDRLFKTPEVERNFKSLTRDYDNAQRKFSELKEKQLQAEIATELESGEYGGGFLLASPAYLPRTPESPNRVGILLLGIMFAFAIGLAVTVIAEYLDQTIRDARTVTKIFGVQPLVVIPAMQLKMAKLISSTTYVLLRGK